MRNLLTFLLDTVFPPSEGARLVRALTDQDVSALMSPHTYEGICALSSYSSPTMRTLIHEVKFQGNIQGAKFLAELLRNYIEKNQSLQEATFVPIPLSPARLRARGYNQVARVLHELRKSLPSIRIDEAMLVRIRDTQPQTELKREERLTNLKDAFMCPNPESISGKFIVIIDDVTTTGSTLKEAERAILSHRPKSVKLVAFAH